MQFNVEYTDTFSGEANYSWVRRASFEAALETSNRALMRKAKALIGLSGVRGKTETLGDTLAFRPHGSCTIMFVTFD